MANKELFNSTRGRTPPNTDTVNKAGGRAYKRSAEEALAQFAVTGCFSNTYYASGVDQVNEVLKLSQQCSDEFIVKLAIYARKQGHMKDMPAMLMAVLSTKNPLLMRQIFNRVIDNGRMLRNFVQIMRSGVVGRKSLGRGPKTCVRNWINDQTPYKLFSYSVGNDPSLSDIIKMVHPRPHDEARRALYGYLMGREVNIEMLPDFIQQFEAFKKDQTNPVPNVEFRLLTSLGLTKDHWKQIARTAPYQMTRMNLNTFARNDIFSDKEIVRIVANRLKDPELIAKSRVFPYQLFTAFKNVGEVPSKITNALQDAVEESINNVPALDGDVFVFPDISGSMHSPVTGYRTGATSQVRCIDVAALMASFIVRKNEEATVLPFGTDLFKAELNPRDSVVTNAERLSALNGGGTNCSLPLAYINKHKLHVDAAIYISDNESWLDGRSSYWNNGTETMNHWNEIKARCPNAKLVCIDIMPGLTTQAVSKKNDILNVGGFSDEVFKVISSFLSNESESFVDIIDGVMLD